MKDKKIILLIIIGFIFGYFLLFVLFSNDSQKAKQKTASIESGNKKVPKKSVDEILHERLVGTYNEVWAYQKEDYENIGAMESLQTQLSLFEKWALAVRQGRQNTMQDSINSLADEIAEKLSQIQTKRFPVLRQNYRNLLHTQLWVDNIEVEVMGNQNTTIQFTGGTFANNRNKLETFTTLKPMLEQFRFKRVNFKWYKYDEEYTYWEIDSKSDQQL